MRVILLFEIFSDFYFPVTRISRKFWKCVGILSMVLEKVQGKYWILKSWKIITRPTEKSLNSWKIVACCCISQDTYMNFVVGASQLFLVSETNIEKKVAKYVVFCFMQRNYFQCLLFFYSSPTQANPLPGYSTPHHSEQLPKLSLP